MKKIYSLTFLFILFVFYSNSQSTYYKMLKEDTTTWQHFGILLGVKSAYSPTIAPHVSYNSIAAIDTITINGYLYKYLYHLTTPAYIDYSLKSLMGYIREDTITRRVYFKSLSNSEMLLYDFGLNVNDSILMSFPIATSDNGYYRVDSIVTKNEINGPRKHFFMRKHVNNWNPNFSYFDMVEGVGSTFHILYPYFFSFTYGVFNSTNQNCSHPWNIGLACKHDDESKQFQSCTFASFTENWMINDSCTYFYSTGSLKKNDLERIIKIGPNPTNDKIEVSIEHSFETINCSVTDMTGKIIFTLPKESISADKKSFSFSTKDLAPGIYILQVKLNETLVERPIVVQH
ncbi:MAG: T9SS type A sorting domain-containing protein [Sphingobacteriaceae bacterium]|nr:T9SS type A sorting domain-containing protein [Sphingobacteriaceae bacterium]